MKILVSNHWLRKIGGSETFTYTLVGELVRRGHQVDLFTNQPGIVSTKIQEDFGVKLGHHGPYDLILANHNTTVERLYDDGYIIQTCHGTTPKLEQPSSLADSFVSISQEVKLHLQSKGFESEVILNGIDCKRFRPKTKIHKSITKILSLTHSVSVNNFLKEYCHTRGIKFVAINKYLNPLWEVEKLINQADLVVSLGRGAYEAMACGRPVLVYDHRPYQWAMGDGMIMPHNIDHLVKKNCSGRTLQQRIISFSDMDVALSGYNANNQDFYRSWALENLNIESAVSKYFKHYEKYN